MTQFPSLDKITKYFPNHRKCLVKTLLLLMGCILSSLSVNLNKCKKEAPQFLGVKGLNINNIYARFIRFFKMQEVSAFCLCIARLSLEMIQKGQTHTHLIIDRTNWRLGGLNRNILQLGMTLNNNCLIPIFGVPLDKRGNSKQSERIKLLELVLKLCPFLGRGDILLGDREFIGRTWIEAIIAKSLSFVIRLRKDDYLIDLALHLDTTVAKLSRKIKRKVQRDGFFYSSIILDGHCLCYIVVKDDSSKAKDKDGYVRLLTDMTDIENVIQAYRVRWQIEVYFAKTKRKGFNLEDLGLKKLDKVMLMVAIVGWLYTLTMEQGIKMEKDKPIMLQLFDNTKKRYKRKSTFMKGLDSIKAFIFSLTDLIRFIKQKIPRKINDQCLWIKEFIGKSIVQHLKSV